MKKSKAYEWTFFDSKVIEDSILSFLSTAGISTIEDTSPLLRVSFMDESWSHDTLAEFLADYRKKPQSVHVIISGHRYNLDISFNSYSRKTEITFQAPSRKEIEELFNIYEQNAKKYRRKPKKTGSSSDSLDSIKPIIFIGHGGSEQWRDLKDHLHEKHHFKIEAYETGARAGHGIRDILESMLNNSSFAILVLTGEDKTADGGLRARQNVIHEAGLFQGRLGFNKAIVLLEEGTEDFSNINGIQQIRYSKENIKETFGEIVATINREFVQSQRWQE